MLSVRYYKERFIKNLDDFECKEHEEAYTEVVYHASNAQNYCNTLIHCSITDILIITLSNINKMM